MKKNITLVLMLFLLVACKDNPTKEFAPYLKGEIIIENGSKINISDIFELKKEDEITNKIKKSKIDVDYNKNQYLNEINNKVVATNEINIVYNEGNTEYKYVVPIKIKDSVAPKVTFKNTNPTYIVGDEFDLDILKEDLGYVVSDASDVSVVLEGADKITTNKARNFKVKAIIKDSGNNVVNQDIVVSILKPAIVHDFPFDNFIDIKLKGSVQNLFLVIPSKYTTANKVIITKRDYQQAGNENTYNQQINLNNGMILDVYSNNKLPVKGVKSKEYKILDFDIQVIENQIDKYLVVTYGKSSLNIVVSYDGSIIKYSEVQKILEELLKASYVK